MDRLEIRFSGSGGQGLQLSAKILTETLMREGRTVARSQSYEPTSRGGVSRSDLVVGEQVPDYPLVTSLNYLIILDQCAAHISTDLLNKNSLVIIDNRLVTEPLKGDFRVERLPLTDTAIDLGNRRVANIVALGALVRASDICQYDTLVDVVRIGVPKKFLDLNLDAISKGYEMIAAKAEV